MLPLAFDYGLYQMIMAFRIGARLVLERSFAFPAQVLARDGRRRRHRLPRRADDLRGPRRAEERCSEYDFSTIRYVTNTAAALPVKHITMLRDLFPTRADLLDVRPDRVQALHLPAARGHRSQADQRRHRHPQHRAVARRRGRQQRLGPNQVGQLVIRGATVMRGYWEKPEATAKKLKPGPLPGEFVLYTGDFCRLDDEGYLYFVGRMDDIIKSRGEKVAPKEVENVLYNITGVRDAAVIGVPDDILGQAVKAFVVLEQACRAHDEGHPARVPGRSSRPSWCRSIVEIVARPAARPRPARSRRRISR